MGKELHTLTRERKPGSVWLDLFAVVHLLYATLFLIGPATDLGGLAWFPFYLLGATCLILGLYLLTKAGK